MLGTSYGSSSESYWLVPDQRRALRVATSCRIISRDQWYEGMVILLHLGSVISQQSIQGNYPIEILVRNVCTGIGVLSQVRDILLPLMIWPNLER